MTVDESIKEIETSYGKNPPDLDRIKAAYQDLIKGKVHADFLCLCPSCLYQVHKSKGGRFDKETFFLDWLLFEIQLSRVNQTEKLVFESDFDRGQIRTSIEGKDGAAFFKDRGSIKALSKFIEKNFPKINHDFQRLNLRLWRFKKSGTLKALERELIFAWYKKHPTDYWPSFRRRFKLMQKIADFIYSRPGYRASQREIQRRFFQRKTVDEIEGLAPWLKLNHGIIRQPGRRKDQVIFIGMMKTSRPRCIQIGVF